MNTERPFDAEDRDPPRSERLIPEIVRRVLEAGLDKLSEGPENVRHLMSELKLPKEALGVVLSQLDETKNGVYRAVAREVRDFLERSNLAEEITRALTALSFEIKTEVRFVPNDAQRRAKPELRTKVNVRRDRQNPATPSESEAEPAAETAPPPSSLD